MFNDLENLQPERMYSNKESEIVGVVQVGAAKLLSPKRSLSFVFHNFESLPSKLGEYIFSPYLRCHNYLWRLSLYPGGHETNNSVKDNNDTKSYVSIFLCCKHPTDELFHIEANFTIYLMSNSNSPGNDTVASSIRIKKSRLSRSGKRKTFKSNEGEMLGFKRFKKRSSIIENHLDDGALNVTVDIEMYMEMEKVWKPRRRNFAAELLKMLHTGENSDITFIVGDEKFTAHRNILSLGAPTLINEILCNDDDDVSTTKTGDDNGNDNDGKGGGEVITIHDVDPNIFRYLLHFIYTDDLNSIEEEFKKYARSILVVANKFGCSRLKLFAEASIVEHDITDNNVLELLLFANATSCPLLKEATTQYCVTHASTIMSTEEWKELKKSHVEVFANLTESILKNNAKAVVVRSSSSGEEGNNTIQYESENISSLRRKLDKRGLDIDGTREMLIERLNNKKAKTS